MAIAEGFGSGDDAVIDVKVMLVRTIDALEMPHIEALAIFRSASEPPADDPARAQQMTYPQAMNEIGKRFGISIGEAISHDLEREGLLLNGYSTIDHDAVSDPSPLPYLTNYGELVLAYMREASEV